MKAIPYIEAVWVATNTLALLISVVLVVMHAHRYISARKLNLWRYTLRARANIRRDAMRGLEALVYLGAGTLALFNSSPLPSFMRLTVLILLAVGPILMAANALLDALTAYRLRYREGDSS